LFSILVVGVVKHLDHVLSRFLHGGAI
jgi:hypothetical protein